MEKPTQISVNTYQETTRITDFARFNMHAALTGPGSIELFNENTPDGHDKLLEYNDNMLDAAWVLVKSVFTQTESLAKVRSIGELNANPVFSVDSIAYMIKMSQANTTVSAYSAQEYVWTLIQQFQQIYHGHYHPVRAARRIGAGAMTASKSNAHEIRALLGPDSKCNLDFMRRFPDKVQAQADLIRYHCAKHFQALVTSGGHLLLNLSSSFGNAMVATAVIDALERLTIAPLIASNDEAMTFYVGTHYCTARSRTKTVDEDMADFLCTYAIPWVKDWDQLGDDEEETPEEADTVPEDGHVADSRENKGSANQPVKTEVETSHNQLESGQDELTKVTLKADSKPAEVISE